MSDEVELSLLPGQRALFDSNARIVALVGGYGAGKTRGSAYKALRLGLENPPGVVGCFVEPTYTMVRDVALKGFQEAYADLNIPTRWRANDHILQVAERFDLLLRSGDQPELLKGLNLGWAGMDEPAIQKEEVFVQLNSRIREPKATLRQLWMSGTPEGRNWFCDVCESVANPIEVIRARTIDNPHLPEDYVKSLLSRLTPEEQAAYMNGEFISFDGAWFRVLPRLVDPDRPLGWRSDVSVFRMPDACSDQIVLAVDTGGGLGRDSSAIAVVDKRDGALVASWRHDRATIHEMCDVIEDLYRKYTVQPRPLMVGQPYMSETKAPMTVVERNGIGHGTIQECQRRGLKCVGLNQTESSRYNGLEEVRNAAISGALAGGPDLVDEAKRLVTKDAKFVGPKDLCMAIGMAFNHIRTSPYIKPMTVEDRNQLRWKARLGRQGRSG